MEHINECQLTKFYQQRQDRLGMFFWVQSVRFNLPSVSIAKSIEQYLDFYNIDGDIKQLEVSYYRMLNELKDAGK